MPTVMVMESQVPNYRLERWIALFLAMLFFLPFVAKADQPLALVRTGPVTAPALISFNGNDSTVTWRCKSTGIDGFRQCALMLDEQVLTWRMAPEGEELQAVVRFAGDLDHDSGLDLVVDISRNGMEPRRVRFLSTAAKQRQPRPQIAELR